MIYLKDISLPEHPGEYWVKPSQITAISKNTYLASPTGYRYTVYGPGFYVNLWELPPELQGMVFRMETK